MTADDLKTLASRPAWSKHVVIWVGTDQRLDAVLSGQRQQRFDILDLFDEDESLPAEDNERKKQIESRLQSHLKDMHPDGSDRVILRVDNSPILARYKISLQGFFEYFGGSRTMVVMSVSGAMPAGQWQAHLEQHVGYDPEGIVRYLSSCLFDSTLVYRENTPDR
jgi:hypothetical protein